jgi:LmbE family N-acetylglucosaminyl deacetylase
MTPNRVPSHQRRYLAPLLTSSLLFIPVQAAGAAVAPQSESAQSDAPKRYAALLQNMPQVNASVIAANGAVSAAVIAQDATQTATIQADLRRFREMGRVLHIAAHPDDENTQLLTYLARGRGYSTAYLSVTRGDGGQNVLGGEFGGELGLIRTQELLAARRLDGSRQFFTRALDFGFSKDYRETLRIWDHQQVLGDVVRIVRTFRPDVIVTRFSPEPGGTHGHHTASAVLALEAFKLAGDPTAFPEQLTDLKPWQPKRLMQNSRGGGPLQLDINGTDPVIGESFARIAGRSRAMHKSQGFGNYTGGDQARPEGFQFLAGEPATKDIMDGIDTSWNRVPGGAPIGQLADAVIAKFNPEAPEASVPALLDLRTRLSALPVDPILDEKRRDLDRIIQACVGLTVQTTIPQAEVVQGEPLMLRHTAQVRSAVPVRWVAVRYPSTSVGLGEAIVLQKGKEATRDTTQPLPLTTPISQPYWLRQQPAAGMFRVVDPKLIGQPENSPSFAVQHIFEIGGQTLVIADEPIQAATGTQMEPASRRLEVIPPVSLHLPTEVYLFDPGAARPVTVEVVASRAGVKGSLKLDAAAGWKVEPATQPFRIAAVGERVRLAFNVTAPAQAASADIVARAEVNGVQVETQRKEIRYSHLAPLLVQSPAQIKAIALDVAIRGREVGYLPGAGDNVAEALEQMGYTVTQLLGADLTLEKLRRFDAVVTGVRAFNVRTDWGDGLAALFAYVEGGGNLIVQYNRPDNLKTDKLAPFDLNLSSQRVTDENAPVTFLAPEHPALNTPNKITAADFEGWTQERGIYFPNDWGQQFTPLIAAGDPGEEPLKGGLLVAKHGRGYFVYSGLVWFRQFPAGVPGAYRLFANLVSLGK